MVVVIPPAEVRALAEFARAIPKAPAARHTRPAARIAFLPRGWSRRILEEAIGKERAVGIVVEAPFGDISKHVVEAPVVRSLQSDLVDLSAVRFAHIEPSKPRDVFRCRLLAGVKSLSTPRPACVFPFCLSREIDRQACLFANEKQV